MVFGAWLRCLRITDGAAESVQAEPVEPVLGPAINLTRSEMATLTPHEEAPEPIDDIAVNLDELRGGVLSCHFRARASGRLLERGASSIPSTMAG